MTSLVSRLLTQKPQLPTQRGRVIRFDVSEPPIFLVTGTMAERIVSALSQAGEPMTIKEIAACICSNPSRVTATIKPLIASNDVVQIKVEGCTAEYIVAPKPV